MNIKKLKSFAITAVATSIISACSSSHSGAYAEKEMSAQDATSSVQQEIARKKANWEPVSEVVRGNAYHDLSNYRIQRKDERVLPQEFYQTPILSDKDKSKSMNIDDFAAMLYQSYKIMLDVSSPDLWVLTGMDIGDIRGGGGASSADNQSIGTPIKENNPDVQVSAMSADSAGDYTALSSMLAPQNIPSSNGLSKSRSELKLKPFNFKNGTVKEMLDYVTTMNGLKWRYDLKTNKAYMYVYDTKVFKVVDLGLSSDLKDTVTSTSSQKDDSGGASRSSTQSSTNGKMEPWKDVQTTVKAMMSNKGSSVSFDQSNGLITVTDSDPSLIRIGNYIDELNKNNMQRVTVYFRLVRVKFKESDFKSINQTFLNQSMESGALGKFSMSANVGSLDGKASASLGSLSAAAGGNVFQIANDQFGGLMGFLNTVGSATVSYEETVELRNNQAYSAQKSDNQEYLDEMQQNSSYSDGAGTQDRITYKKATAIDGTSIYMRARVAQNRIFIDYKVTDTDVYALTPVEIGDGTTQLKNKSDGLYKDGNQAMLKNGETRVVGVKFEKSDKADSQGPGSSKLWFFGGKETSSEEKTAIITTISAFYTNI